MAADSPHEYIEQLKARIAALEATLKIELEARAHDRKLFREERAELRAEVQRLRGVIANAVA